jgi:hypothetical protein
VGHIVDEVITHLGETFLTEYDNDGEEECQQQDSGEDKRWYHEAYAGIDICVDIWEVDIQIA